MPLGICQKIYFCFQKSKLADEKIVGQFCNIKETNIFYNINNTRRREKKLNCVFLWSHQNVFFIFLFVLNPLGVLVKLFFFFQLIISQLKIKEERTKKPRKYDPLLGPHNIQLERKTVHKCFKRCKQNIKYSMNLYWMSFWAYLWWFTLVIQINIFFSFYNWKFISFFLVDFN